ncbi:hypothetical protein HXX76_004857 [Chlamydomonas incerta]|uniref:Uncharacterized protein n=1 Tax=Chlamydomonas incerta TaxID=51695 RepID=A0A835TAH1_CHLIN|nr:hypothetical protein HXX76_004857 [Chlamydomonas incerta]|eukprot:KAG2439503.1 hypothetical protein HXX76_004857 [Chlamydomonas incerta]
MQRGVMVTLVPGDEVLFGAASATEPDAEPEVAFMLQSVDAEVGAALMRSNTATLMDASQASAGADGLPRSGYVKCEPSGPAAEGGGAVPLMLTYSQPGTTATPAGPPASASRQQGLPLTTPLSRVSAAGPAAAAGASAGGAAAAITPAAVPGPLAVIAHVGPAAAEAAGAHALPVLAAAQQTGGADGGVATGAVPQPAGEQEDDHMDGEADAAGGLDAGADVDLMAPHEEAAPAQTPAPAPAQQPVQPQPQEEQTPHLQHARVKDEPVDESPLGEQQQLQEQEAGPGAEPPSARPTKTPADGGVNAVLNECKDIVGSLSDVLFPASAAACGNQSDAGPSNAPAAGAGRTPLAGPQMSALWRGDLQALLQRATMPRTTIGVVGDTGAGKSSLLNALLGEEDILPTNAMRASTGCPIELSYSASAAYHAEVEFQTKEEWEKHLDKLMSDLLDEHGVIQVVRGDGAVSGRSEAGVAQAMLEAVYGQPLIRSPGLTADKLRAHSNRITQLLGKMEPIRHGDSKKFREKVGVYVDSHNKATSLQAWPIVKVCRIAHRWKLLEGGVVLVDLPGTRDANEARGRVAEEYMRRLSAVWVVADITRAVDNKTAKDLLGTDFKRRMVMDGQVNAITFICTKTDNLDVSNILNSLSVEEVCARSGTELAAFHSLDEAIMRLQDSELAAEKATKQAKRKATLALNRCRKAAEGAKKIRDAVLQRCGAAGVAEPDELTDLMRKAVPPKAKDKKGGRDGEEGEEREGEDEDEDMEDASSEEELTDSDDSGSGSDSGAGSDDDYCPSEDEEDEADSDASTEEEDEEDEERPRRRKGRGSGGVKRKRAAGGRGDKGKKQKKAREPKELRGKEVPELMEELRQVVASMPSLKGQYTTAVQDLSRAEKVQAEAAQRLKKPQVQMRTICAVARNHYSRERLQEDFREGIIEMLQQSGDQADAPAALDVDAIDLPVFCVSSREAQKLEGIVRRDRKPSVFSKLADTQLPRLRSHVTRTADAARVCAQRRLVQDVYATIDSVGRTLLSQRPDGAPDVSAAVQRSVGTSLAALPLRLDDCLRERVAFMYQTFITAGLQPQLHAGSALAVERAPGAAKKFDMKPCDPNTRMNWMSYRAAMRRNGVFASGSAGNINWNGALAQPIMDRITATWARLFQADLPQLTKATRQVILSELDACVELARQALGAELAPLKGGQVLLPAQLDRLDELYGQVRRDQERQLGQALEALQSGMVEASKALSQDVVEPAVCTALGETYLAAASERGTGSFQRMKDLVETGVTRLARHMLPAAAQALLAEVEKLVAKFGDSAAAAAVALVDAVRARFALLWDDAPAGYEARYAAAAQLAQLLERAAKLCARAGVHSLPPAFVLPPPPEALPADEAQEEQEDDEYYEEGEEEEDAEEEQDEEGEAEEDETDENWLKQHARAAGAGVAQPPPQQPPAAAAAAGGNVGTGAGGGDGDGVQADDDELRELRSSLAQTEAVFNEAGEQLSATIIRMKEARRDNDENFDTAEANLRCKHLAETRTQTEYVMDSLQLHIKQLEAKQRAAATGAKSGEAAAIEGADAVITLQLVRPGAKVEPEAGGQAAQVGAVGTA